MNPVIQPLPTNGPLFEGAIRVYGAAFALPPYSDPDRGMEVRIRMRDVHRVRAGFQAFAAVERDGAVVGMIYGYRGAPGQWWHDVVRGALPVEGGRQWLASSYELVEVAVSPACQGQGIGTALIEALLRDREEATCVLSTRTDSEAHRLYGRLGFEVIKEMPFSPGGALFYVMGKRLC
jgi:ribosomal protein S18 acetylase RimI-like enzyme